MRWTYYAGWVNVVLGVVLGIGFVPLGLAAVGAILLVTLVGSGAFMIWLASGWDRPLEDATQLYEYGRPANARVLSVSEERLNPDGGRVAKVQLHVAPVNESHFKTTRTLLLPGGRVPAVGEAVTVKFDPQHRRNVVLLEENMYVESPTAAAMRQMTGAMRSWSGTGAVMALACLMLAAPAGAARTELVRMPAHSPQLVAGGAVFFSPASGDQRVVRAVAGQPAQTLVTLDSPPGNSEFASVEDRFRLAASDTHVAASRFVLVMAKGAVAESSFEIHAGLATGPLASVHKCVGDHPIDVEDNRLAHVNGCNETGGVPPVLVRNLNNNGQVTQVDIPPARVTELDLAGFHMAMLSAPGGNPQIAVQQPGSGTPFYTVPADNVVDFSVQADGKLAVKEQTQVSCRIVWYSKAEPTPHNIDVCPEGDIVLAGDRIALTRETDSLGSLDIIALAGGSQRVATLPLASTVGFDFDGSRVAYAIAGCVPARDAVYVDDLTGEPTNSSSPTCAAKISKSNVRASSKGIVRVGVSCKEGCQGGFRLTRGGKAITGVKQTLMKPGSGKVSLRLNSATRKLLADRGSLSVKAEALISQNNGVPRTFTRTIRLLEPK